MDVIQTILILIIWVVCYIVYSTDDIFTNVEVYPGFKYKINGDKYKVSKKLKFMSPVNSVTQVLIDGLYKTLMDITKLFKKHGIVYFATGGTLISCIRHKTLMPWDDDIDLAYFRNQHKTILSLGGKLNKLGYILLECLPGFVIQSKSNRAICVDLFTVDKDKNKSSLIYSSPYDKNNKPMFQVATFYPKETFDIKKVYPLKEMNICNGNIQIYVPNRSKEILMDQFGKNVMTEVYSSPRSKIHKYRVYQWILAHAEQILPTSMCIWFAKNFII